MSKQKAEMLMTPPEPQPAAGAGDVAIGQYVLRTLGRPANLIAVQVRPLWEDHYRVNVLVGESVASVTIAHSYFLVMGSDGTCLSSQPALAREYGKLGTAVAPTS